MPNIQGNYSLTNIVAEAYGPNGYKMDNLPVITMAVPSVNTPYCLPPNGATSVSVMNYGYDPYLTFNWYLSGINQTQSLNNNMTLHLATPYNFSYGDIEVSVSYYNPTLNLGSGSQSSWGIPNCNGAGGGGSNCKGTPATATSLHDH